jgi:hypothetical protein
LNLVLVGLIAAIAVIYAASSSWRVSVKTVLVLAILEGALRKWALPQASELIYFLKDFVLVGAYLSYFGSSQPSKLTLKDETIKGLTYLVAIWCVFEAFNPSLGSPIIGIFGIRNYLLYIPLMWIVPSLFQSEEELYRYLRGYLLFLIPVAILAIAQYFSPLNSPLNVYASDMEHIAVSGGAVRVTGTFSYLAGYSTYLSICLCLLLPLILKQQTILWRLLSVVELSLIVVTSFMTGARGLMIFIALLLVGYIFLEGINNFASLINSLSKFLLPAIVGLVLAVTKFNTAIDSFEARAERTDDLLPRMIGMFTEPFRFFQYSLFNGYGAGATFQANEAIRSILHLPPGKYIPVYFEGETGRIALELGIIGFFVWYGFKIVLLIAMWKVYRQIRRPFLKQLAICIFLFQAISLTGQIVFNHTANLYYWFFNGFIFLLPQLERIEIWKQNYYLMQSQETVNIEH